MVQDIFKPYKINYSELGNYEMVKGNIFFVMDQKAIYLDLDDERRIKITPTKVSEIENDSHFIDKTVNDLTNYYTKNEIDTLKLILLGAIDTKISFEDIPELFQKLEYGGHVASVGELPSIVLESRLAPTPDIDSSTYTITNLQEGINDLNQSRNSNFSWRNMWIKAKKEEMSAAFNLGTYGADYRNWLSSAWVGNFGDPEWGITFIYKSANTTVKFFLFNGTSNYGDDVTIPVYLAPTDSFIELQLVDCGWRVYNADTGVNTLYKYDEEEENDYITIFSGDEDLYIYPDIYDSSISAENINFLSVDTGWDHPPYTGTAICGTAGGKLTLYKETSCPAEVKLFIQNNSDYIFGHWLNKIALPEFDIYEGDPCVLKNGTFLKIDNTGIMTYNFLSNKIGTSDLLYTVGSNADIYYISKYDFEYHPWSQISSASIIAALGYTPADAATLGQPNGIATLDSAGKVPAAQLPAFVDDVLEFANRAAFPETGESGKIYVALDTNLTYRWSGSTYVEISQSLALGETETTAYRGDRGKIAYDHATDANKLTTAKTSDLYKISTTTEGHIAGATAMTQADFNTNYDIKPTVFVTLARTNRQSSHTRAEIQALVAANYEVIGKWEYSTGRYMFIPLLEGINSAVFGIVQPESSLGLSSGQMRSVIITIDSSGNGYTQQLLIHKNEATGIELTLYDNDPTIFHTDLSSGASTRATIMTYGNQKWSYLRYYKVNYQTQTCENILIPYANAYDSGAEDVNTFINFVYIGNLALDDEENNGVYKYTFRIDGTTYPNGTISKVRLDNPEYIKTKTFDTTYVVPYHYPYSVTATNSTCLFDSLESNTSESDYAWIGENQRLVIPYGASFDPTDSSNYGSSVTGSHLSIKGPILVSFYYLYSGDGTYTTNSRFLYLKSGKVQQYEDNEDIGYYTKVNNDIRTDVQVNGTSIVSNNVANLVTNTAYDSTSNKLATMADIQSQSTGNSKVWYGTSSTTAVTQTKIVDCSGFVLETGATLIVKFTYGQGYLGGAPQLNVNNTGAKEINWTDGNYGERYQWGAGAVIQFVYDGAKWIMEGRNPASTSNYGLVKLVDGVTSSATNLAATPKSVKTAYDLANTKQDALVSGTNIKTVNNQSILGSGNLDIAVSPEIAISTTQPTGDEVLWINPNEVPTGGSGGGSEPDVFSTTETLTNKIWIDGKPIYRKCVEYDIVDVITSTNSEVDISNLGADMIFIDYTHSYLRYPAEGVMPVGYSKIDYYQSTRNKCSIDIDNQKMYISIGNLDTFITTFDKIFIVFEYTKAASSL